jgi:hypothetical protein
VAELVLSLSKHLSKPTRAELVEAPVEALVEALVEASPQAKQSPPLKYPLSTSCGFLWVGRLARKPQRFAFKTFEVFFAGWDVGFPLQTTLRVGSAR